GAQNGAVVTQMSFPEMHWHSWASELWIWLVRLGEPILIGLPLLAVGLAISGYIVVRVIWRVAVIWKWRARRRR
uniref:DUF2062 domain-containing protein n=1 Tax=Salmonella enterica TaxID=28901 RepID=UPI00329815D3